jgi:hypothetical protein
MAELLAMGDSDAALGAESVPGLRMQQIAPTNLTIPLTFFEFGLTMGHWGFGPPDRAVRTCLSKLIKPQNPYSNNFLFWRWLSPNPSGAPLKPGLLPSPGCGIRLGVEGIICLIITNISRKYLVVTALGKLKKWLTGKAASTPVSLAPPPALLERYRQYKRLLAANSAILTMVTDLQVKMNEGFLFDMHYVRGACQRLGQEVEAMAAALMAMSGPLSGPGGSPRPMEIVQELAASSGRAPGLAGGVGEGFWRQGRKLD